jgi:hypothetical protein
MIQAEEDLLRRARRMAARRGVSIAQLVRDALEHELGEERQPPPLWIGTYRSEHGDLSERASRDEYEPDPSVSGLDPSG